MSLKPTYPWSQPIILTGFTVLGLATVYPPEQMGLVAKQPATEAATPPQSLCSTMSSGSSSRIFAKTELFFGLRKPEGSQVTEIEFQDFLTHEVTPHFPDGLTLLSGYGQFKTASGQIVQEPAKLLILLYPLRQARHSNQKIEQIRQAYQLRFQQESVLRTDEQACVSF
jgi:hypothetical protein